MREQLLTQTLHDLNSFLSAAWSEKNLEAFKKDRLINIITLDRLVYMRTCTHSEDMLHY